MAANKVTIVICYQAGTQDILAHCLCSLYRHTKIPFTVDILTQQTDSNTAIADDEVCSIYGQLGHRPKNFNVVVLPIGSPERQGSGIHGTLLDNHIPSKINSEYLLTLDSDCFPIADGWLEDLIQMMDNGARVVGILHPWAPPPDDMPHSKLEWRVRSQHCWETTHVACQMLSVDDFRELGCRYNDGDDTGLAIPLEAKKRGWKIDGFRITRCPRAETDYDPEFNRYVGLVFGDRIYHQGGATRVRVGGDEPLLESTFGWVKDMIKMEGDAEFLLDDEMSYKFRFDREEEIAAEKMQRLFGLESQQMRG